MDTLLPQEILQLNQSYNVFYWFMNKIKKIEKTNTFIVQTMHYGRDYMLVTWPLVCEIFLLAVQYVK